MAINKIGQTGPLFRVGEKTKAKSNSAEKAGNGDRVELSEEAKMLYSAEKAKKMGEIRARVTSGFYDSPEVTAKIVEGLLRDLRGSTPA